MMLSFFKRKSADDILAEHGFRRESDFETENSLYYRRWNDKFKYAHYVVISLLKDGDCVIQSYDGSSNGNTMVGLTYKEFLAVQKKIKELGWDKKGDSKM